MKTFKYLTGGKNHWNFSERSIGNLGNGYSVTNHWIYQNRVNGLSQGDFPPTVAGRTIYTSPYRSDTLYWRNLDPGQDFLFEQVPTKSKDLKGAKQNFYKWVNKSEPESSRSNSAYQRAKRGYQSGGELPTAPRAEERYRNGRYTHRVLKPSIPVNDSTTVDAVKTNNAGFFGKEGYILRAVDHSSINPAYNDTTYMEVPPVSNFLVNLKTRGIRKQTPIGGSSYYQVPYHFFGMFGGNGKSTSPKDALEYRTMTNRFNAAYKVSKHQEGEEFKENLNPPTDGVVGEIKRNLRSGWQQGKRIASSIPLNILLGGIGAGATNVNLANKGKLFANWLVKDENPGLELLSALGWIGSGPAIGVAMFDPFGWAPNKKNEKEIRKYGASSRYDRERKVEEYRSAKPLRR